MAKNGYSATWEQFLKVAKRPKISGAFALDKGLWDGRKVAVNCIWRGNARRYTRRVFYYGTLDLTVGTPDQIGVRHPNGEVTILHKTHAVDIYDMTREKPNTLAKTGDEDTERHEATLAPSTIDPEGPP